LNSGSSRIELTLLEGTIEVRLQFYTSVTLKAGQGIQIDSAMGHAYVAKDCESALVLVTWSSEDLDLARELINLTGNEAPEPPAPS
jgi:hypothetical protein